jgi:hypothetical protein
MYSCLYFVVPKNTCNTHICNSGGFSQGMRLTNGDGTVPLLSLGYMCNEGWINDKYPYNPANVSCGEMLLCLDYCLCVIPHLPCM